MSNEAQEETTETVEQDATEKRPQARSEEVAPGDYPPGLEPELEGEELERARRKEKGYTWLVRFQLLFIVLIIVVIVFTKVA